MISETSHTSWDLLPSFLPSWSLGESQALHPCAPPCRDTLTLRGKFEVELAILHRSFSPGWAQVCCPLPTAPPSMCECKALSRLAYRGAWANCLVAAHSPFLPAKVATRSLCLPPLKVNRPVLANVEATEAERCKQATRSHLCLFQILPSHCCCSPSVSAEMCRL